MLKFYLRNLLEVFLCWCNEPAIDAAWGCRTYCLLIAMRPQAVDAYCDWCASCPYRAFEGLCAVSPVNGFRRSEDCGILGVLHCGSGQRGVSGRYLSDC